jgi:phytepsin
MQHPTLAAAAAAAAAAAVGPSMDVAAINEAIGAESAFTLQCKSMVADYVPQIIEIINQMPLDQVGFMCISLCCLS